jgi:two-component system response regulator AtoC
MNKDARLDFQDSHWFPDEAQHDAGDEDLVNFRYTRFEEKRDHRLFRDLGVIGRSPHLMSVLDVIRRVADSNATIFLEGESGTGKEIIAKTVHNLSSRRDQPFVVIDCSTIVDTLMESELFGHERGAFTGAVERKVGKFEAANRGTIFLDEIAELPLPLQPKLLRIIQEKEFTRVGGVKPLPVDVRIVAASGRSIDQMTREGTFRQELFYRLKVVHVHLPPLRERSEDIPVLANHFMLKYAADYDKPVRTIEKSAMLMLTHYSWPGNVRNLEHVIERAVVMSSARTIAPKDIVFETHMTDINNRACNYRDALREFHRTLLLKALSMTGGNKRQAAKKIGISHAKFYRLLEKSDLKL